ncbi:MAG TPA: hypothetical protein PL110_06240 [Candidatus Eremiobacteraeota bacterium]|nr:MAG: hypothetical protein BWY64_02315 [bacterium ADurb.Bin363]HPZ07692.1 hypothetical protein [Candidatus Eremiobacteraeota bacterium]
MIIEAIIYECSKCSSKNIVKNVHTDKKCYSFSDFWDAYKSVAKDIEDFKFLLSSMVPDEELRNLIELTYSLC